MATKKKAPKKPSKKKLKLSFKAGQHVVYPAHGVGTIKSISQENIAGFDMEVYVVCFDQDKMTLRVPTIKADKSGMRALANDNVVKDCFTTLRGRARVKRTMWSRRAQEYEGKINSGDLILLTEVVRDLYRTDEQPDQSYSERQLYERAIDRLVREIAAIDSTDRGLAMDKIINTMTRARERAAAKAAAKAEKERGEEEEGEAA